MTYKEFKEKYNGKYTDFDGAYGFQCWDLAQRYFTEVLKLPSSILSGCGLVSNMLKGKKYKLMLKYFDVVNIPKQGDVAIWEYGHIAIYDHAKNFYFSQNPNPCRVIQINRSGVHFFRKKGTDTKKEKVDQILHKGSKVKFNGTFLVDKINVKNNTWCNYSLIGGKPTKPYHWLPSTPFDNITGSKYIKPMDKVRNKNTYIVQDVDKKTDSAKLKINGRICWIKCKYLKEV